LCVKSNEMATALFISEDFLKDNTQVSKNVDVKYIREAILWAQDSEIQTVLGTTFYEELKTDVIANTLTGVNKALMDDYILPCLKHYVTAECVAMAHYKITNKGLQIQNSEQSQPAFKSEVDFLIEKEKNKAQFYQQRLINYLCEFEVQFPSYANPDSGVHIIQPSRNAYTTSFFLGRSMKPTTLQQKYRDE
jgi:hypothetical protein